MARIKPYRIKTISEFHRVLGLPKPEHPLVSVIRLDDVKPPQYEKTPPLIYDFYSISIKRSLTAKYQYGQQKYDFDDGVMFFIAPGQVFGIQHASQESEKLSGWLLAVHPDFLWKTRLATSIRQYEFFEYDVNEALFLSPREEETIERLLRVIQQEYQGNIDNFSQDVIVAQLELLLVYSQRFYHRQFLTRKTSNYSVLNRLEALLEDYFNSQNDSTKGLLSVQYVADQLHMSPNYLSSLLKSLTGQSTQQHIHEKLIEKAKERLSTTELSVTEIAYGLGFEHPQSFSKLFKAKTKFSPYEFRNSFN